LDVLNNVATASIVLGFCGGVFSYFILRPLNNAIVELRVAVRELRSDLRTAEERRQQLEIKVAEIDQRAKAAHNRLDEIIKRGERQ
jgi:F0F1-type ATP synthase membrane subunit b/b'